MIYATQRKDIIVGTIVTPRNWMTDMEGNKIQIQPFYIIREATYKEYAAQSDRHSKQPDDLEYSYYEISTD